MNTFYTLFPLLRAFIVCFFLLNSSVLAQNYLPGFVINQKGDSLRGYVLFEDHVFNRKKCLFKTSLTATQQSFAPSDIRKYGVDGIAMFRSAELGIKSGTKKWVFVEYMLQGTPSLLYYGSKYFLEDGNKLEALAVRIDTVKRGDQNFLREGRTFKNVLRETFESCSDALNMLEETKSSARYFYDLFQTFYECKATPYQSFISKGKWVQFQWGAGVSGNRFNLNPKRFAGSTYYFEETDLLRSQYLSPFVSFRISYPRLSSRLAIRAGLAFSQFAFSISDVNDRSGVDLLYEMDVESSVLEIPITISYNLTKANNKAIVPYLFAGGGFNLPLNITGERRTFTMAGLRLSSNSLASGSGISFIRGGVGSTFKLGSAVSVFAELWGEGTNGFIVPDDNDVLFYKRSIGLSMGVYLFGGKKN